MIKYLFMIILATLSITPQKGFPTEDIAYNFQIAPQLHDGTYGEFGSLIEPYLYGGEVGYFSVVLKIKSSKFEKNYNLFDCQVYQDCSIEIWIDKGTTDTETSSNDNFVDLTIAYNSNGPGNISSTKFYYLFDKKEKVLTHEQTITSTFYTNNIVE